MSVPTSNFEVLPSGEPGWLIKQIPEGVDDPQMYRRMATERAAYSRISGSFAEAIPEVNLDTEEPERSFLIRELDGIGTVSATDMVETVIDMQLWVPSEENDTIPVLTAEDYLPLSIQRANQLREVGRLRGLSHQEIAPIIDKLRAHEEHIGVFALRFVHTDAQSRHFGWALDDEDVWTPRIYDFDQAHIGNELEDLVWMMTRHPQLREFIIEALRVRFEDHPEELKHLEGAITFFETHFLLKGVYDRHFQSHGRLSDYAYGWAGRLMMQSQTARTASAHLERRVSGILLTDDRSRNRD